MEKKEIIAKILDFLKSITKRIMILDSNHNNGMSKLIMNILVKENVTPCNIAFISPTDTYFNEIFPKTKETIKANTKYSIGTHKLSFHIFDKNIIKTTLEGIDMIIMYPIDSLKEKEITKFIDNNRKIKKLFLVATAMPEPTKTLSKITKEFISLKPSEDTAYYDVMKQKLFDIK